MEFVIICCVENYMWNTSISGLSGVKIFKNT